MGAFMYDSFLIPCFEGKITQGLLRFLADFCARGRRPFLLRRIKSDVEASVPPKAEIVLWAQMTAKQKELNEQLRDRKLVASSLVSTCYVIFCQLVRCPHEQPSGLGQEGFGFTLSPG